jgi:putative ABC transport system ATP-binding protein
MLQTENLKRYFYLGKQKQEVLRGIDLQINQGELVALMGPSGSGKSTLLGLLAGIDSPDEGSLQIDGKEIGNLKEKDLSKIRNTYIGIVFQSFNLIPGLTAQQNVEAPLYVSQNRQKIPGRAKSVLDKVGLGDKLKNKPHQLSGGQQQRVGIARALVTNPKVLIADEPTGNLDSQTGQQILNLFQEVRQEFGLTMVIATHDEQVAGIADRVVHIQDGVLVS